MTGKIFATLLLVFLFTSRAYPQTDSVCLRPVDTVAVTEAVATDSNSIQLYQQFASHTTFLSAENKPVLNDVEQFNSTRRNGYIFALLLLLLAALTYVKTAFGKDLEEMLQSVVNRNMSQQVFRTQSGEISFADILLNANFVVAISMYARFFLVHYFHVSSLDTFYSVLFLIFLFTFFYLFKIITLQFIGKIFELQQACDEYIFYFTTLCKTLGLALLPALFVFYTASEKIFNFLFIITILFFIFFALIFVWRVLSTAYKLMYRSVYHFFIYVCVVEISTMFLFFKLFTKTIP